MRAFRTLITTFIIFFMLTLTPVVNSEQPIYQNNIAAQLGEGITLLPLSSDAWHGEDNLLTNIIPNGNFNLSNADGSPSGLDAWGSGYYNYTLNYEDQKYGGSYAYMVESQGSQFSATPQAAIWFGFAPLVYLNESLVFDYWVYQQNDPLNPDDSIYTRIRFRNSTSGTYYNIYNYMSYNNPNYNSTYNLYLDGNSSSSVWNNYNLDLSQIFLDWIGSITDVYLFEVRFYTTSPAQATNPTRLVLDDLSLTNSTLNEYIPNGNFEFGTVFSNPGRSSGSTVLLDSQGANSYANMTATSFQQGSTGYTSLGDYYGRGVNQIQLVEDQTIFNFDYQYSDTDSGGSNQQAYLYLSFENSTYSLNVYWYLGYDDGYSLSPNSTNPSYSYYYVDGTGVGTADTWNQESIDLFKFTKSLNLTDMAFTYYEFGTRIGQNDNSSVTLLLDNLEILAPPIRDNGFEDMLEATLSDPFPRWSDSGAGYPAYNRSTDSRSGEGALNITVDDNQFQSVYRLINSFEVQESYFTNFWFRLDDRSDTVDSSQAYYQLTFEGGYNLYYVIAGEATGFNNNTNNVYYLLDTINVENQWINIVRNVWEDMNEAFGSGSWNVTNFSMAASTPAGTRLSVLFDDSNFIQDTRGPNIDDLIVLTAPLYYSDIMVKIDASDLLSRVAQVNLFYRTTTDWISIPSSFTSPSYYATIPAQNYNDTVEFYIQALDIYGNMAIEDNVGQYYSFEIGDDIAPVITVNQPFNNSILSGIAMIELQTQDLGSSIRNVEIFIDGSLVSNSSNSPFAYEWNTRLWANGTYAVEARSWDNANNMIVSTTLNVVVSNDLSAPIISDILAFPLIPTETEEISFTVSVTDDNGITSVKLFTKLDDNAWQSDDMAAFGSLYTALIDPIDVGSTLLYYIEATDQFDQTRSKGSQISPYEYGIPEDVLDELDGLDEIQENIEDIYANNQLYAGMASVVSLWMLVQLIKLRRRRKSKK